MFPRHVGLDAIELGDERLQLIDALSEQRVERVGRRRETDALQTRRLGLFRVGIRAGINIAVCTCAGTRVWVCAIVCADRMPLLFADRRGHIVQNPIPNAEQCGHRPPLDGGSRCDHGSGSRLRQ